MQLTKVPIPIPIPDITPLKPPLGVTGLIPTRVEVDCATRPSFRRSQAIGRGLADGVEVRRRGHRHRARSTCCATGAC